MNLLNIIIQKSVPLLPKILVGMVAKRYIAGATLDEAMIKVKSLNNEGFAVTMDVLGESAVSLENTDEPVEQYLNVLDELHNQNINGNISLKLTQFGLNIDKEVCWEQLKKILDRAAKYNIFVRIDMEDSSVTDSTIELYKRAKKHYSWVGLVIQGYLYRSFDDVKELVSEGIDLRICKGIYRESAEIAIQSKEEVRQNTIDLIKYMLDNNQYIAIASHDLQIISAIKKHIITNNIATDKFEFQSLLGVPIENTLRELKAAGYKVRYYVPFGEEWYAYSSRRLAENPDLGGYIVKDFFKFWES